MLIAPVYGADSPYADIRDFGAVSGSDKDNYNAIQAAIDSLGIDGGTVLIPEGTYCTSQTLKIRTGNVEIIGIGPDSSRLCLYKNTNADLINAQPDKSDEWFALKDLTLEGGKSRGAKGRAFYNGDGNHTMRDVHMYNLFITSFDGVSVELSDGWGTIIDNVVIEFGNSHAIVINKGNDVKITNCKIIQNKGSAVYIKGPYVYQTKINNNLLSSGDNQPAIYLNGIESVITGNTIIDDKDYKNNTGILVVGGQNTINDNLIMNAFSRMNYGIVLKESATNNLIADNQITTNDFNKHLIDEGHNIFVGKYNLWGDYYYIDSAGPLYLQPFANNDVYLFNRATYSDGEDTPVLSIRRNEGDDKVSSLSMYIDGDKNSRIIASDSLMINAGGENKIKLDKEGISLFSNSISNGYLYQYGYVDNETKYVRSVVNSEGDYTIEREDSSIKKMRVDMPVEIDGTLTLSSPNGTKFCCGVSDEGVFSCFQGEC